MVVRLRPLPHPLPRAAGFCIGQIELNQERMIEGALRLHITVNLQGNKLRPEWTLTSDLENAVFERPEEQPQP
jgi:hypothetical protein